MKNPVGHEVFEYFNNLVCELDDIRSQRANLMDKNSIQLEVEETITEQVIKEAQDCLVSNIEKEKQLEEEEKETNHEMLEARQETERVEYPSDEDERQMRQLTNQLQAIHDKADNAAASYELINNNGVRHLVDLKSNKIKEMIEDIK